MKLSIEQKSKWYDHNHDFYIVNNLWLKEDGVWVEYTKEKTGKTYTCLQEAFLHRFKEQLV